MNKLLEAIEERCTLFRPGEESYIELETVKKLITEHIKEPDVKRSKIADEIKSKLLLHFTNPKDRNYGIWLSDEEARSIIDALESIQSSPTAEELMKAGTNCISLVNPETNEISIDWEAMARKLRGEDV